VGWDVCLRDEYRHHDWSTVMPRLSNIPIGIAHSDLYARGSRFESRE